MVIAVTIMRMVQVTVNQVVDVIAMRYRLVPATRTVDMVGVVMPAGMIRRALNRVLIAHGDRVLLDRAVFALVVQMTVVQVVDVAVVLDRDVAARRAVGVVVRGVE